MTKLKNLRKFLQVCIKLGVFNMVDYGNTIVKNSKTGNKKLWKEILDHIGSDVQKHIIDGVEYESRADFDLRGTYAHKKETPMLTKYPVGDIFQIRNRLKRQLNEEVYDG